MSDKERCQYVWPEGHELAGKPCEANRESYNHQARFHPIDCRTSNCWYHEFVPPSQPAPELLRVALPPLSQWTRASAVPVPANTNRATPALYHEVTSVTGGQRLTFDVVAVPGTITTDPEDLRVSVRLRKVA